MNTQSTINPNAVYGAHPDHTHTAHIHTGPAASWPAILAGAVVAVGVSLVLIVLGSGLGLSAVSPYETEGVSVTAITISAVIWMIIVQWSASGVGGYVAGRLRNRWEGLHGDEVFFRDSAHGLAAWCVSTIVVAVFLTSAVSNIAGAGTQAASIVAAGKVSEERSIFDTATSGPYDYYIDGLFRDARTGAAAGNDTARDETGRILMEGLKDGAEGVNAQDRAYLAQLVASRTNLSASEAQARVDQTLASVTEAKNTAMAAAEEARKAGAKMSILTALSMVIGAFIASVSSILGGRSRDEF